MNTPIVEVDVHGMNRYQAQTKIDSILRRSRGVYRIRIIHGYRGGTELRDMIRCEYAKNPLVRRVEPGWNEGITELVLREYLST
ncbi:MAG: hypothetical protein E7638_08935 [Ruminococcaceae bacterium]|nr:hypothetical protein [Oscillospiraceae bacterium]